MLFLCFPLSTYVAEEVRIRWVQTQHRADSLFAKIRDIILTGVGTAEAKLATILDMITGHTDSAKARVNEKYDEGKAYAGAKYDEASDLANEKAKQAAEKKGEYETTGKGYWNEKVEEARKNAGKAKIEL